MHGRDRPQRFKFRAWRATHHRQTEKKEVPKEHSTPQSESIRRINGDVLRSARLKFPSAELLWSNMGTVDGAIEEKNLGLNLH